MPFGQSTPQIVLISPTAVEKVSGITDGRRQNRNLSIYTQAMRETAIANEVLFIDCFGPSKKWYRDGKRHTVDGALYNDHGYSKLAKYLADSIFDATDNKENIEMEFASLVMEKNFYWLNDFKVPNGVHVYGRRYNPFGPQNYPYEIEKTREYTSIRDQRQFGQLLLVKKFDMSTADAKDHQNSRCTN